MTIDDEGEEGSIFGKNPMTSFLNGPHAHSDKLLLYMQGHIMIAKFKLSCLIISCLISYHYIYTFPFVFMCVPLSCIIFVCLNCVCRVACELTKFNVTRSTLNKSQH